MIKNVFCFIYIIFFMFAQNVSAVPYGTRDLMALCGFNGPCSDILVNGSAIITNDTSLKWYNAAGNGNINAFKVNSSDNTLINAAASKDIILQLNNDSTKVLHFNGEDATKLYMKFGDGSTTYQELIIAANTTDGNDYSDLNLCAGGYCTSTRGAYITLEGEEALNGGDIIYDTGVGDVHYFLNGGVETIRIGASIGLELEIAKDLTWAVSGGTVAIQEATAGSKCMGGGTHNGTTAVTISTSCATTGSRIFITPTSDPTGATAAYCWVTNIVNGTSFDVDCDQADDGAFNWFILHEAA